MTTTLPPRRVSLEAPSAEVPPTVPADTIRLARPGDARAVRELMEHSSDSAASPGDERRRLSDGADMAAVALQRSIRDGACYVAESGGQLIAACAWAAAPDGTTLGTSSAGSAATARVIALAVDRDPPPLALCRLLLVLCESAARRQGFTALDADPAPSQRWLYAACGFRPVKSASLPGFRTNTVTSQPLRRPISPRRPLASADRRSATWPGRTFHPALEAWRGR